MANQNLKSVYDGLWSRVSSMPGFQTKTLKWTDYYSAKNGRPAVFMRQTNMQAINDPGGLPVRQQITFEIFIALDKKKDPGAVADFLLLEAQDKLIAALGPDATNKPGDECCHLDLGKGWVMHAWLTGSEFYTAIQDSDDMLSALFTVNVLCAARLALS